MKCQEHPASSMIDEAQQESYEWHSSNPVLSTNGSVPSGAGHNKKWKPPPAGMLKCNTDGSWGKSNENSGIGWILRDHQGAIIHFGAKCLPRLSSSLHVEAAGLVWAVQCVKNLGYTQVQFESDSSNLIQGVKQPQLWPGLVSFISDIHGLCEDMEQFHFCFNYRSSNMCADAIAGVIALTHPYALCSASLVTNPCIRMHYVPPAWLQILVSNDSHCIASSIVA